MGITHMIQFLVLFQQFIINRRFSGLGWWLLVAATMVLVLFFNILRALPSVAQVAILFQNITSFLAFIFMIIGILRFFDRNESPRTVYFVSLIATLLISYFLFVEDNMSLRAFIFSLVMFFYSFYCAFLFHKFNLESIKSAGNLMIANYLFYGFMYILRSIGILSGLEGNIGATDFFNISPYILTFIFGLLWTYGFIVLINQRLISDLNETKEHFESVFYTSPNAVAISRLWDGLIIDINTGFTELLGYNREECIGKTSVERELWAFPEQRKEMIEQVRKEKVIEKREMWLKKKNGEPIITLASSKLVNLNGIPHIITALEDISKLKDQERKLKVQSDELKKTNETKNKLFAIIANDLRFPYDSMLKKTSELNQNNEIHRGEDVKKLLSELNTELNAQYNLLDEMLQWVNIQSEDFKMRVEIINLEELTSGVLRDFELAAIRKGIGLNSNVIKNFEIKGDYNLIKVVLRNLVSNSIKYAASGENINVNAIRKRDFVEISVTDCEHDNLKETSGEIRKGVKSFLEAQQTDNKERIGLTLSREIIKKQGGKMWFESSSGKQNKIVFSVPDSERNY